MRHWLSAIGATCAIAVLATAQQPGVGSTSMGGGQIVSSGFNLNPAGSRVPAAAPKAGKSIGSPLVRPYDPTRPLDVFKGTNLDPRNVVAPVTGIPGTQQPDLLDRLYGKLNSATSFFRPTSPVQPTPTITPGIFRRSHARNKQQKNWPWD